MGRLSKTLGLLTYADAITAAATAELEAAATAPTRQVGIASPSAFHPDNQLEAVVWADLTGKDNFILSRPAVIAIPAVARQRHQLCGTVAKCPLVAMQAATPLPEEAQPSWMYRTDGMVHPYHRMLWTVDDLIFHGWSVWEATRGYAPAGQTTRPLLTADRINPERWEVDDVTGRVLVDGEPRRADELIVIPGPHEGILNFGATALRRTIDNLDAAANAARNPSAYLELHYTGDTDLTPTQIDEHIARWAAARRGENGGVAWTNKVLELREHGTHESHLLIEGRNADAVDVSRLMSTPAAMADATNAGASLTYETTEGRNAEFVDYGVGLYMDAIAARLSMDDIVPRGTRAAFDTGDLRNPIPSTTGAPARD